MSVPRMNVNSERYDELLRTEKHHAALAARLAEVEAARDRLGDAHRKVIALQGIERDEVEAERDRLAQELEDTLDRAREAIAYLRIVLEGGHSGAAREFLARFPREGDGDS